MPDDARVSVLRRELFDQRLHPRFEVLGARVRLRHFTRRVGQLLVRDGQRDVVGNATGHRDILDPERTHALRPEPEAHLLVARTSDDDEERTIPGRNDPLTKVGRLDDSQRCRREIVDDDEAVLRPGVVGLDETVSSGNSSEDVTSIRIWPPRS